MKSNVRGQAALEFMMTYGWAILVVLAAIGALSYFGVLNPSRFTPDTCLASAPFSCPGKPVVSATAGTILFSVVNGQGYSINLTDNVKLSGGLNCTGAAVPVAICSQGTTNCYSNDSYLIASGQGVTVSITGCTFTNVNIVKGDATFNYTNPDSKLPEQILVSVTAKPRA